MPYYFNNSRETTCKFEGCNRPKKAFKLCNAHYQQLRRGQTLRPILIRESTDGPCSIIGCLRKVQAKHLCGMHYKRKQYGKPMTVPYRWRPSKAVKVICEVPGCDRLADHNKMCNAHDTRWRRGDRGERLTRPIKRKSIMMTMMANHIKEQL